MDGGENDCPDDKGGRRGGARRTGATGASSAVFIGGVSLISATGVSTLGAGGFENGWA